MKSASAELAAHLAGEVTTLATCWKLTRKDSNVMGFTDHVSDIVFDGVTYVATTGFTPSAIASNAGMAVDNLALEGMLEDASITEEDIMAGLYDFAAVEVFFVNYQDLSQGRLLLKTGTLGEVRLSGGRFTAELRGLTQALSQTIGELYSPACRAALGDTRCKVNMAAYTFAGSVTSVTSRQIFSDSTRSEVDGYFDYGRVTFTSGSNSGLSMEIKSYAGKKITLVLPMPYTITASDAYSIQAGCDKTFGTCISRFANAVNFRGEPHVPGIDRMLETSGTRSQW